MTAAPASAHRARTEAFATALGEQRVDAAVVSQPQDLYYLTGTAQPSNLLVVPGAEPVLFARRYAELVRAESAVERVEEGAGYGAIAAELAARKVAGGRLALELDVLPFALHQRAARAFGSFEIVDCAATLLRQRAIKDVHEIELMRAAARAFEAVHATLAATIAPGVSELELAAELERALRLAGHHGLVAQRRWDAALPPEGSIASGENLATISGGPISVTGVGLDRTLPLGASRRRLRARDVVNVDLGMNVAGYHADMARTYVLGEPEPELLRMAAAVRAIEDRAIAATRPGVPAGEPYAVAAQAARELGVADVFQGFGGTHGPYVGHGIGLELDEPPVLGPGAETPLRAGMVLAIEPKLISPRFGAVNLEDDVVVRDDGPELLSTVPRTVFAVDGAGGCEPLAGSGGR